MPASLKAVGACLTAAVILLSGAGGSARAAAPAHAVRPPVAAPPPTASPSPAPAPAAPRSRSTPTLGTPAPVSSPPVPEEHLSPGDGWGECGWLDMGCKLKKAINDFFTSLVKSALNPVFRFMARTLLAAPRVDQLPRVYGLWGISLGIANTCFVLLVTLGGILLMSHQSLQTSYTINDIAPRLVVAVVAANANLPVIGQFIDFANALSVALMGTGVDPTQATDTLKGLTVTAITDTGLFMPLLGLVTVIIGVIVVITCVFRIMLLVLLTAIAPLALACHALPHTEALARLWWRAIAGVLAIGVAQSLVLSAALRVFFTSDQARLWSVIPHSAAGVFDLVLTICLLYVLARIPSWISQMVTRGGMGRSPIIRAARTVAAIVIFRSMTASRRPRRPTKKKPPTHKPQRRPR